MLCQESVLELSSGQSIALKTWRGPAADSSSQVPVLALHGWLDNAATFDLLAPLLSNATVFAVDLPGHGRSSHRAEGAEYYIWSYIADVIAIAEVLELEKFSLMGHSMGGAIACLVSSLYPQRVQKLVLLDTLGPLATKAKDAPEQMKKALKQKSGLKSHSQHLYPSWDAAVAARAKSGLQPEAAALLAKRGVTQIGQEYYWCNDPRLSRLNLLSMTEEQIAAFLKGIKIPTLLISTENVLSFKQRLDYIARLQQVKLGGGHHQHLEDQAEIVARLINEFFSSAN